MDLNELEHLIDSYNKKKSKEILTKGSLIAASERIPTGILGIDYALGGGWPMGRQVVLWGNKSSTKSTTCLWTIKEAQKLGKNCLYIDAENTWDASWAEKNGVDAGNVAVAQVTSIEDILDVSQEYVQDGTFDVVVIDSITPVYKQQYFEDGNNPLGMHARGVGELLTKLNAWNKNSLILLVSQERMKGLAGVRPYHDMTGGKALEFYPSVAIRLSASQAKDASIMGKVVNGDNIIEKTVAYKIQWKITKNKISDFMNDGHYIFFKAGGHDRLAELIDIGVQLGLIRKRAAYLDIGSETLQGVEKAKEYLADNMDVVERLTKEIVEGVYDI